MPSSPHSPGRKGDYGALSQVEDTKNATDNSDKKRPFSVPRVAAVGETIGRTISESRQKKIPLRSFLWHQHSVLGMTVPDDEVVPPISAGPCCEIDPTGLTRRRRMFLFFLVFFVSTTLAVQVSLGHHGSFYALNCMILIVLPMVCHLKENLPTYSKWFISRGIGPFGKWPGGRDGFRVEELALIALYVAALHTLWKKDMMWEGVHVLDDVLWIWFGSICAEMACLVFKYYCGKYLCCCFSCCVPTTYSLLTDEDEGGEDDDDQCKKLGA